MQPKMLLNWAGVQSVIVDAVDKPGGATWKEIKEAIEAEGWTPRDWLTQVRGPLQNLIDTKFIERIDKPGESECYVIASKNH